MVSLAALAMAWSQTPLWIEFNGGQGPGKGKHIVFLAGDEEYRSEESFPQLAKILSSRHGFRCTVVFSLNQNGEIDPNTKNNQPGIEALDSADLCVMLLRFREWPDAQMKHFVDYFRAGKPILAFRTSTHAFDYQQGSTSPYRNFGWRSREWAGGFGEQVLGENWISHWGAHGTQATRGVPIASHPILNGVENVFGNSDVYEAAPPADAEILMRGHVLAGMNATDPPAIGRKKTAAGVEQGINEPAMPIVWTRNYRNDAGKTNKVLTCTMGAATDFQDEGLRRLLVNAAYWATGLEKRIPAKANVGYIGVYTPSMFGFDKFKRGVKPADLITKS